MLPLRANQLPKEREKESLGTSQVLRFATVGLQGEAHVLMLAQEENVVDR